MLFYSDESPYLSTTTGFTWTELFLCKLRRIRWLVAELDTGHCHAVLITLLKTAKMRFLHSLLGITGPYHERSANTRKYCLNFISETVDQLTLWGRVLQMQMILSTNQHIHHVLYNPNIYCRVHKSAPLVPILIKMNRINALQTWFS
jgi:hypothetical protein